VQASIIVVGITIDNPDAEINGRCGVGVIVAAAAAAVAADDGTIAVVELNRSLISTALMPRQHDSDNEANSIGRGTMKNRTSRRNFYLSKRINLSSILLFCDGISQCSADCEAHWDTIEGVVAATAMIMKYSRKTSMVERTFESMKDGEELDEQPSGRDLVDTNRPDGPNDLRIWFSFLWSCCRKTGMMTLMILYLVVIFGPATCKVKSRKMSEPLSWMMRWTREKSRILFRTANQ
jgi:hypothetical protein